MSSSDQGERIMELNEGACYQFLRSCQVGRIAFNREPSPEVLPVNYIVRDNTIIFQTGPGAKQIAASQSQPATFQVDGIDDNRRSGWSVIARGHLALTREIDAADLPEPLPGGERPYVVTLVIETISGRRIPQDQAWALSTHAWRGQDGSDLIG